MPGGPDDGAVLFRPVTQPRAIFFGQLALGYQRRPLHTSTIVGAQDRATLSGSSGGVVDDQFTTYATAGFQVADRFTVAATLPVNWVQDGQNPNYSGSSIDTTKVTALQTGGPGAGDLRLDMRAVVYRSIDRRFALGAQLSVFTPSGSNANFGGDGGFGGLLMVNAEYTMRFLTFVANTGLHFRPDDAINDPAHLAGLGVGNEWRWAVGAFIPFKDKKGVDRFRVGATLFGQTGIESSDTIGDTAFTKRNSPIEYHFEGRMKFGPSDHWWVGGGAGSRILLGYGAPDFRIVGMVGAYVPILESQATSPERRAAQREKWRDARAGDADHDGIPDDIDACPSEPEDRLGNDPSDGCPLPPDRDHDGIPDQFDKCPDVPEDKDGIDDADGCPEDDVDTDGIPDATDACPKEPGPPNPDPKRNGCPTTFQREGETIRVFQQVHFQTGSATILPDSFPMLQEITNLLRANPTIKRMAIEGHTDNRGDPGMNMGLSQSRAESVMNWILQHGIAKDRIEAHGYGLTRPVETNDTEPGRTANRRVEFKILVEEEPPKKNGAAPKDE